MTQVNNRSQTIHMNTSKAELKFSKIYELCLPVLVCFQVHPDTPGHLHGLHILLGSVLLCMFVAVDRLVLLEVCPGLHGTGEMVVGGTVLVTASNGCSPCSTLGAGQGLASWYGRRNILQRSVLCFIRLTWINVKLMLLVGGLADQSRARTWAWQLNFIGWVGDFGIGFGL